MGDPISLIYVYGNYFEDKIVDPERYGYIDVVYDAYSMVLKDIPDGKTVNFSVKVFLPDGVKELVLGSDSDVLHMFHEYENEDQPIQCFVFGVEVSKEFSIDYTVNGFHKSLMQRSSPTLVENNSFNNKNHVSSKKTVTNKTVRKKTLCKRTVSTPNVQRFAITGSTNNIGNISNSSVTIHGCGRDFVQRRRELTPGASSSMANTQSVILSSDEDSDSDSDDQFVDKQVGDEAVGDDTVRDEAERDEDIGDEEVGDDDSVDSEWGKDSNEVRDDDSTNSEKDLEIDEDEGGVADSDGNLSDIKSDDSPDEIDCWVEGNIDQPEKSKMRVGLIFADVYAFRAALKDYVIEEGIQILRAKNEKTRVTAVCVEEGCNWRIHASTCDDGTTFMVKTFNSEHSCGKVAKNSCATSTWIAKKFADRLKADPDLKNDSMKAALMTRYGIVPHDKQLYRARLIAKQENEGSFEQSYSLLPSYGKLLMEHNPGTIFKLQYHERIDMSDPPVFKRVFVCLKACQTGFLQGCRPLIGLDGCHLKSMFGGVLLSAIAVDGNNGLFPVAYSVVECENKDSWLWFLECLKLGISQAHGNGPLTFMSDKQKGLSDAIQKIFPQASQRHCCRHLYNNFKNKFPGVILRRQFWAACKSANLLDFQIAMENLKALNNEAYQWLNRLDKSLWARHSFDHRGKTDHVTNNMSESFNQWIAPIRGKSIIPLLDHIRVKLMSRLMQRYETGCSFMGKFTPKIKTKLDLTKNSSRSCRIVQSGVDEFEVMDERRRYTVKLDSMYCGCGYWESSGLPCKHAIATMVLKRKNIEDYCSEYYTTGRYMKTYGELIHSLPDLAVLRVQEGDDVVKAPPLRRLSGRPRKNRRREAGEAVPSDFRRRSGTVRCLNCKEIGHNRRTCQRAPVREKQKMRKQGQGVKRKGMADKVDGISPSPMQTRSQNSANPVCSTIQGRLKEKKTEKAEQKRKRARTNEGRIG